MNAPRIDKLPTLFCLHALGASRREFETMTNLLDTEFEVVALDLPGFGDRSTASGVTIDDMVRSVIRSIRSSGAARWMLVAHSMGGKIASIMAARTLSGEAGLFGLAGVVLLAASPPSPEPMDDERRARMLSWVDGGAISERHAREFVDANVGAPLSSSLDAQLMADVQRSSPEAWRAWLERGSREDRSADVGVLDVPALIITGGADGDLGEAAQLGLNGPVYPRARQLTLAGAGHLLPYERPSEVAEAISVFWHENAGAAPAVPPDFGAMIASSRTSAKTRGILVRRSLADDPDYSPQVLTPLQLDTLRAVAALVIPQDGAAIDLAARVDAQLAAGGGDGWRNAALPPDGEASRRGLDALADLAQLSLDLQRERIAQIVAGEFEPAAGGFTGEQLTMWFEDCRVDLVRHWLAHPATMARIGFDGIANGGDGPADSGDSVDGRGGSGADGGSVGIRIQGFNELAAGRREGWEPAMGTNR